MGSIEKACISGFLCRLCSEMHRTVIHIYGDHGQRLCLVEKINGYLPITISPTDPLPKTICKTCLHRVEQHYTLLMRLTRMREERKNKLLEFKQRRNQTNPSSSSVEASDEEDQASPGTRKETRGETDIESSQQAEESNKPSQETTVPQPNSSDSSPGPSNRDPKETGTRSSTGSSATTTTTNQELT
ncbi:uncharacterized protein LOC110191120 [Drosophila serrata]|uniref:uncharacterized protein LOC110191120 n=1 Tax=Drosophila serrata TaxID=7274 RepID=UPI000A1CFC4E|nr:uncharacterized protein LOC110191120 [Drosophila serrata]